jgi:hypothetical protein
MCVMNETMLQEQLQKAGVGLLIACCNTSAHELCQASTTLPAIIETLKKQG